MFKLKRFFSKTVSAKKDLFINLRSGENEFKVTAKDVVLYNESCYLLIKADSDNSHPRIDTFAMKKLIKDGIFKQVSLDNPPYRYKNNVYYMLA